MKWYNLDLIFITQDKRTLHSLALLPVFLYLLSSDLDSWQPVYFLLFLFLCHSWRCSTVILEDLGTRWNTGGMNPGQPHTRLVPYLLYYHAGPQSLLFIYVWLFWIFHMKYFICGYFCDLYLPLLFIRFTHKIPNIRTSFFFMDNILLNICVIFFIFILLFCFIHKTILVRYSVTQEVTAHIPGKLRLG